MRLFLSCMVAVFIVPAACSQTNPYLLPDNDATLAAARACGANVVVLERKAEVWLDKTACTFELLNRVQIIDDRGKTSVQFAEPIPPGVEILMVDGKVIEPDGESSKVMFVPQGENKDTLALEVKKPACNTVVEYHYLVKTEKPVEVFQWFFESSVPSVTSSLALTTPQETGVRYKVSGAPSGLDDPLKIPIHRDGIEFMRRLWQFSNLGTHESDQDSLSVILLLGKDQEKWPSGNVSDRSSFWGRRNRSSSPSITTRSGTATGSPSPPPPPKRP